MKLIKCDITECTHIADGREVSFEFAGISRQTREPVFKMLEDDDQNKLLSYVDRLGNHYLFNVFCSGETRFFDLKDALKFNGIVMIDSEKIDDPSVDPLYQFCKQEPKIRFKLDVDLTEEQIARVRAIVEEGTENV